METNQQNKSGWISRFLILLPFIFLGSMALLGLLGAILKGGFWNVALTWGVGLGVLLSVVMFVFMNKSKKFIPKPKSTSDIQNKTSESDKDNQPSGVIFSNTTSTEKKTKARLNADFQTALFLNDSGKVKEAFELMKKTADAGHSRAQFNTGVFYAQGHGVQQDFSMAVLYYSMAAMLGDRDASYNLGLLFYLGQGVKEPDYEKAFSYFLTAAQLGDYLAMAALSYCYNNGKGVEKDEEKSVEWGKRALNTPGANPLSIIHVATILRNPDPSNISYS